MAETPKALSVSFRQDAGSIEHNNRIFVADNVDGSRSPDNIVYVQKDLRELYHELFDGALAEYNSAQTRKDRVIENYYEHIKRGKKEKLFQEVVVTFGNSETCGVGSENWQTAINLLDEYMQEFEKRNPNLKVFNAVMHLDEACPHLHIDFVPVCYNQNQGLKTRVSMKRAIQQMLGITTSRKKECEAVLWCSAERDVMTKILNAHQIKSLFLFVIVLDNIARRTVQSIANACKHVQVDPPNFIGIPLVNDLKAGVGSLYKVVPRQTTLIQKLFQANINFAVILDCNDCNRLYSIIITYYHINL